MKKPIGFLILLSCCLMLLSVSVFADNFGLEDDFGDLDTTEQTTEAPGEQSSELTDGTDTDSEGTTAPEGTTEPAGTESDSGEQTSAPEGTSGGMSETTEPEESVSGEETSDPAGTDTESGDVTTERPDVQTTEPVESPSESETQSEQGTNMPLPFPVILAVLGVLGVGCIAVVVFVLIKYVRA